MFADKNIQKHIADFNVDDMLVLNEFKALVNSCPKALIKIDTINPFENRAALTNKRTLSLINRYVNREWNWSQLEMDKWKELRERALQFPTLSVEQAKENRGILDVYIGLPKIKSSYSYEKEGDFKETIFDFDNNLKNKVSAESARLEELFSIPGVYDYFVSNNYATQFKPASFIICPVFFHNIYKGVLGEIVGKFIFQNELGITLEELPQEHYELFDYKVKGTDVYIDFKHWQENSSFDADTMKDKITRKLSKVQGSKAIIVNILTAHNFIPISSVDGTIIEIANLFDAESQQYNTEALKLINASI